jgi:cyanoexosortase A
MPDSHLTQLLKHRQYGLLGLCASLFSVYLVLVWRVGDLTHLGVSGLFLLAALTLIWENHVNYVYRHDRAATLVAAGLIGWMLWQTPLVTPAYHPHLRLFPFISGLAVALIASGFRGLLQYRRELAIMFFLGVPSVLLTYFDISWLTAAAAELLLKLAGFNVVRQNFFLTLPVGTTAVHAGFSGVESIAYLLGIAAIALTLYPVERLKQISALLAACVIPFWVNSIRVAVMATLAAPQDQREFLYWYEGDGALIFGVASIILFALFYWLLYRLEIFTIQHRQLEPPDHRSDR